jgi:hypothetical protein
MTLYRFNPYLVPSTVPRVATGSRTLALSSMTNEEGQLLRPLTATMELAASP